MPNAYYIYKPFTSHSIHMKTKMTLFLIIASIFLIEAKVSLSSDLIFAHTVQHDPLSPLPSPAPVTQPAPMAMAPPLPPPPPVEPPIKPPRNVQECSPLCAVRCKYNSRNNVCMRCCLTCCVRCKCVPPGQYGNKEVCGTCYTSMTTHGGKLKCP